MAFVTVPWKFMTRTGKFVQKAFYQNDLLVDSIQSFYDNGIIKSESVFKKGSLKVLCVNTIPTAT
jgi:antitoxin component YwqK of YwqJK toxin-antitoxin module